MQYLGWAMLLFFFGYIYFLCSKYEGYWEAAKGFLFAISGTAFVVVAIYLIGGGFK